MNNGYRRNHNTKCFAPCCTWGGATLGRLPMTAPYPPQKALTMGMQVWRMEEGGLVRRVQFNNWADLVHVHMSPEKVMSPGCTVGRRRSCWRESGVLLKHSRFGHWCGCQFDMSRLHKHRCGSGTPPSLQWYSLMATDPSVD